MSRRNSGQILRSGGSVSQGSPGNRPWSSVPSHSRSLTFDLPGVRVGIAEREGPTGITVFHFPERVFGQRLAIETHASMARAIQPFHTSRDGDTLFAVTTATCDASDPS